MQARTSRSGLLCAAFSLAAAAAAVAQPLAIGSPDGRRAVTAVRADAPPVIDGRLDDALWQAAPAADGFVQSDPREGQPATEQTQVHVAYDDAYLYIAARCLDSRAGGVVVNDIHKDFATA